MSHTAKQTQENGINASGRLARHLASDVARCNGSGSVEAGIQSWREGCEMCLRRTAPRPELVVMMAPPPIIAFECEYLISPNVVDVGRAGNGAPPATQPHSNP